MIALEQNIENCTSRLQDFSKSQQSNLIRCFFKTYYSFIFLFLSWRFAGINHHGRRSCGRYNERGRGGYFGLGMGHEARVRHTIGGDVGKYQLRHVIFHGPYSAASTAKANTTGSARQGRRRAPGCRGRASRRAWRARAASCG